MKVIKLLLSLIFIAALLPQDIECRRFRRGGGGGNMVKNMGGVSQNLGLGLKEWLYGEEGE